VLNQINFGLKPKFGLKFVLNPVFEEEFRNFIATFCFDYSGFSFLN